MKKEYMNSLVKLTEIMQSMDLVALKHGVTYYYWVVKYFDLKKQEEINKICEENNLEWDVKPAPQKVTNGKPTSTGNKLNDIRYKRKPLSKGKLPLENSRAKIIVRQRRKRK